VVGRIRSTEKSNDLIRNQTHDHMACSIVPQSTTLPMPLKNSGRERINRERNRRDREK
jgi:hypothetical protein